ncbi:MAG TPA: MerR family transcriptional regulator [Clostridiaceae bacterium]|nr:MerR family transcriptional regulator [Clostridiaceae bacterium]
MAELRNCRKCGKLFNYIGGVSMCQVCKDEDEADFQKIKKYLYENPGASISQISGELNMTIEKIKRFLREGRLEIVGDNGIPVLHCEKCSKPIKTGRFCEDCSRGISKEFSSVIDKIKNKTDYSGRNNASGMRYLSKDNKKKYK